MRIHSWVLLSQVLRLLIPFQQPSHISHYDLCICPRYLPRPIWLSFFISISHAETSLPSHEASYPPAASHHLHKWPGMTGFCQPILLSGLDGFCTTLFTSHPLCLVFSAGKPTPWHVAVGVLFIYQVSAPPPHRTLPNHLMWSRSHRYCNCGQFPGSSCLTTYPTQPLTSLPSLHMFKMLLVVPWP